MAELVYANAPTRFTALAVCRNEGVFSIFFFEAFEFIFELARTEKLHEALLGLRLR